MKSRNLKTYLKEEGAIMARAALGGVSRQSLWNMLKRNIQIIELDGTIRAVEYTDINLYTAGEIDATARFLARKLKGASKHSFTHIGPVKKTRSRHPDEDVLLRESDNFWIDENGQKYRKANGCAVNRPDLKLAIEAIRVNEAFEEKGQ